MKTLPTTAEGRAKADAEALPAVIAAAAEALTACLADWHEQARSPLSDEDRSRLKNWHASGQHFIHDPNDGAQYGDCQVSYATLLKLVSAARQLQTTQRELLQAREGLRSGAEETRWLKDWLTSLLPRARSGQLAPQWLETYELALLGYVTGPESRKHDAPIIRTKPQEALRITAQIARKSPGAVYKAIMRHLGGIDPGFPLPGNPDK